MLIVKDSPDFVIVDLKNWGFAEHYYDFFFFKESFYKLHYIVLLLNYNFKITKSRSARAHNQLALKTRFENLSTIIFQVGFARVISVVHHFIFILNENDWGM